MRPANNNYSFCPSCGKRIYSYEDKCSGCGTYKVIFEELRQDSSTACCKRCGCILQSGFAFCPSCGNACNKANAVNNGPDYEATNTFLKIMRACSAALFAIFFAINAIWCSLFGIFYGALSIVCSFGGIALQIFFNHRATSKENKYSIIFIAAAVFLIIIAVIVMVAAAYARAEIADSITSLLF